MAKSILLAVENETHAALKIMAIKTNKRFLAMLVEILEDWLKQNCHD